MKKLLTLAALVFSLSLCAQSIDSPDKISTYQGDITIQPITHGSVVLKWEDQVIYVDPYGGGDLYKGIEAPTYILITDIHGDHMNPSTLEAINTSKAQLVVPQAVKDQLPDELAAKAKVLSNGSDMRAAGFNIAAIPMYNLPESEKAMHTKGRGNGYVITMGGKRLYFSGDTADIPEMRSLNNIDVAFVCMNLPYTMDINQAASAVLEFKPIIVYPYHYRGTGGLSDVDGFKDLVNEENPNIEVRLKNWYPGN
ncbi:MAG: MBL fold metallo-hydrolase [Cytophagia bacterium]|nr:MBL fold metallo-hydrolase [Cytophagia bacterium]